MDVVQFKKRTLNAARNVLLALLLSDFELRNIIARFAERGLLAWFNYLLYVLVYLLTRKRCEQLANNCEIVAK